VIISIKKLNALRRQRTTMSRLELARQFYWCDELSFYKMRTPLNEAMAFAEAHYDFRDDMPDVPKFLPRLRIAQEHAANYVRGRLSCTIRAENPEDAYFDK
jgi:hypothetical protein